MTTSPRITALIPTFDRVELLERTLKALLSGSLRPAEVLVSDGTGDARASLGLEELATRYPMRLLSRPALGTIPGNRNHLVRNCPTEYALLMDDDTEIHPRFLEEAFTLVQSGEIDVACAQADYRNVESWFTFRGYWRPRRPTEPTAVSPTTLLTRTAVLRRFPFDEHLVYGYEEADLSMRMRSYKNRILTDFPSIDLAREQTVNMDAASKRQAADSSRVYVALKSHWGERTHTASFCVVLMANNLVRGRRVLPRSLVSRQWRTLVRAWFLGKGWPWPEELRHY
jgi:glycosyltransferase involved in cell wall biosynthesis